MPLFKTSMGLKLRSASPQPPVHQAASKGLLQRKPARPWASQLRALHLRIHDHGAPAVLKPPLVAGGDSRPGLPWGERPRKACWLACQEEREPEPEGGGESLKGGQDFGRRELNTAAGREQAGPSGPREKRAQSKPECLAISSAGVIADNEKYFPFLFWAKSLPKQ